MLDRHLWNELGGFKEDFVACEDYDLWLRYTLYYPVGFLPKRLVIRYGGHSDQLSSSVLGLDLFRIYSILDILKNHTLTQKQRKRVIEILKQKASVYIRGCIKRGKFEEVNRIRELIKDFTDL